MTAPSTVQLLLISGSTRHGSTNTAALRSAAAAPPDGVTATVFASLADLPAFNPDHDRDPLPSAVTDLRRQLAAADAVIFCTPEYAGALPGSFKNLLDWTVGGEEIYRKPVAWINVAAEGRGVGAHASLATVLGYVGAEVIEAACVSLPVPRDAVGPDGLITDADLRARIALVLDIVGTYHRDRPIE
ncbi:MAG: NADPH-dependent FMN reductase [Geodermatophilaceae bacterium]